MIRFAIRSLLLGVPIAALVIGTNLAVDPSHLFDDGAYEQGLAALLLEGWHVADVADHDERQLQQLLIARTPEPPDVIVLGSSRSLEVTGAPWGERRVRNHSVSGATLEDYLAVYALYARRGWTPRVVVLGLDPWVVNRQHGQVRWKSYGEAYRLACRIARLFETRGLGPNDRVTLLSGGSLTLNMYAIPCSVVRASGWATAMAA